MLPGQGLYHDPEMIDVRGRRVYSGYVTDLITDFCLDWLRDRDQKKPFCLLAHHEAPHRPWEPDANEPEWELFDLEKDPHELNNVYADPEYAELVSSLRDELHGLQEAVGDERYFKDR